MSKVDLDHLRLWIGKEEVGADHLSVRHARLMAATLGLPQDDFHEGAPLPPLWHWIYFLEGQPPAALGPDGHPARGGFLPPTPLPNRMWAGGDVHFNGALPLGTQTEKRSRIQSIEHKQGRSGELIFVTVLHEVLHRRKIAISETHDIVYKQASGAARTATPMQMPTSTHSMSVQPDSTMLMRYSALTFNGHRIHYDADYCRKVEGYPDLVIHGPLCATLLAGFAQQVGGRALGRFRYRGIQPSLLGNTLSINAAQGGDGGADLTLWIGLPDGGVSMQAEAWFQ